MENASKALIIAGAILLSIAIIGIGMSVFNQAQNAVNNANMSEAEITTFNSKFEAYEGTAVSGSRVRTLVDTIRAHNNTYSTDYTKQVRIKNTDDPSEDISQAEVVWNAAIKTSIKTGDTYQVVLAYNATGLIVEIGIVSNNGVAVEGTN